MRLLDKIVLTKCVFLAGNVNDNLQNYPFKQINFRDYKFGTNNSEFDKSTQSFLSTNKIMWL